jgi:regulator of protease activity HflC (stomatin/prohibitin superfamily)
MKMLTQALGRQIVMTKDNIQLTVEANVFYRSINPIKSTFGVADISFAVK